MNNEIPGIFIWAQRLSVTVVLLMGAGSLYVGLTLPPGGALGWPPSDSPLASLSAPWALSIFPALGALVAGLMAWAPRLEPRRNNLLSSAKSFGLGWIAVMLMVGVVHFAVLAGGMGFEVDVPRFSGVVVGVVLGVVGNYLGKSRSSFFGGVPTPWALSSERAWVRSHRLGGKLFIVLGVVTSAAALVAPRPVFVATLVIGLLGIGVVMSVHSYRVWRSEPDSS